jgi:glutamate--cysteine ligase
MLDATRRDEIEQWFTLQREKAAPFFYTSVDLRHSGMRLLPVDTNLYPAGFNNLSPAGQARASRFVKRFFAERYPQAKRILIVPENHTRNLGYLENLATLMAIIERTGLDVQLGSLAATDAPIELQSPSGRALIQQPIKREGERVLLANGFNPDVIVMNNDMTAGAPEILRQRVQPVVPPLAMGWWQRRKSIHFAEYKILAEDFAKQFGLDPWLLAAEYHRCGMVDFKASEGLDCLARGIEKVLLRVREKYREYGITQEPYVYVKAESGTYGMGIMTVRAPEEVLELNKKSRNKMQVIKEGARVSEVILQEGVPTVDRVDGKPAEPVVYMIDGVPVGGMYRVNKERDALGNLNAAGMEFTGMCDEVEDECGQWKAIQDCHFRSLGLVAAIAALAAAREDYRVGRDGAGI